MDIQPRCSTPRWEDPDSMETTHTLPLLTWIVLLGPMPFVLVLTVAGYLAARSWKKSRRR